MARAVHDQFTNSSQLLRHNPKMTRGWGGPLSIWRAQLNQCTQIDDVITHCIRLTLDLPPKSEDLYIYKKYDAHCNAWTQVTGVDKIDHAVTSSFFAEYTLTKAHSGISMVVKLKACYYSTH